MADDKSDNGAEKKAAGTKKAATKKTAARKTATKAAGNTKKTTTKKTASKKTATKAAGNTKKTTTKKTASKKTATKASGPAKDAETNTSTTDNAKDTPKDSDGEESSGRSGGSMYPGWEQLGDFIRGQRKMMELSQRELAKLTKVSDPYVSQLERGLHEPSVRVLKALADALNVRAETLLSYAGLLDLDAKAATGVEEAIQADPHLSSDQKQTLLSVYRNFRGPIDDA